MTRTLIAGNWKMNGLKASLGEIRDAAAGVGKGKAGVEALLCVPATLLTVAAEAARWAPVVREQRKERYREDGKREAKRLKTAREQRGDDV